MQPQFYSRAISLLRRIEVKLVQLNADFYTLKILRISLVLWVNLYTEQQGKASEITNNLLNIYSFVYWKYAFAGKRFYYVLMLFHITFLGNKWKIVLFFLSVCETQVFPVAHLFSQLHSFPCMHNPPPTTHT